MNTSSVQSSNYTTQNSRPTIKLLKTRNVTSPARASMDESGIDFYIPLFEETFMNDLLSKNTEFVYGDTFMVNPDNSTRKGLVILPGERILIPSGIKAIIPVGMQLAAANKSGVATKKGLIFGAQIVDSTYRGEIHISLINTSNKPVEIFEGEKIIQFVDEYVCLSNLSEISEEEFNNSGTTVRGEGGFGHTGTY